MWHGCVSKTHMGQIIWRYLASLYEFGWIQSWKVTMGAAGISSLRHFLLSKLWQLPIDPQIKSNLLFLSFRVLCNHTIASLWGLSPTHHTLNLLWSNWLVLCGSLVFSWSCLLSIFLLWNPLKPFCPTSKLLPPDRSFLITSATSYHPSLFWTLTALFTLHSLHISYAAWTSSCLHSSILDVRSLEDGEHKDEENKTPAPRVVRTQRTVNTNASIYLGTLL